MTREERFRVLHRLLLDGDVVIRRTSRNTSADVDRLHRAASEPPRVETSYTIDGMQRFELKRAWRAGSALPEIDCREVFGRFEPCPVKGLMWEQFIERSKHDFDSKLMRDLADDYFSKREAGIDWSSTLPIIMEPSHYVILTNGVL